jgi:hypothetical protein
MTLPEAVSTLIKALVAADIRDDPGAVARLVAEAPPEVLKEARDYIETMKREETIERMRSSSRKPGYRSRSIGRRSSGDIDQIRVAIYDFLAEEYPATVRQVFYAMVSRGVVAKTEGEYKRTIVRLLSGLRRDGLIPWSWIADNTRWMRRWTTYSGIEQALRRTAETYRRSLWDDADEYVEVWLEKDALAGVLYEVTGPWGVPLMVTRGYPSLTFLHSAAEAIAEVGKPTTIYYFGDRDPSGVDIPRKVAAGLREYAPDAEIDFDIVAVTEDQITELRLPTRPTKQTDTRAKSFEGESVELDAIPPSTLRDLATEVIQSHVDDHALEVMETMEAEERSTLQRLADRWEAS